MKRRLLALFAVLALVAVPAAALGGGAGSPFPAGDVTHVKLQGTVVEAGAASVSIKVTAAWRADTTTGEKTPLEGFAGQVVTAAWHDGSEVFRGAGRIPCEEVRAGAGVAALLTSPAETPEPASEYHVAQVWLDGGAKPGPKPAPKPGPDSPPVGDDHPGKAFDLGFFALNWRMRGEVLGTDVIDGKNVVDLDVRRVIGGPKRFRDEGRGVATLGALVVIGPKVVITGEDGARIAFSDISVDDRLLVIGRFLKPAKWLADDTGEPVPTVHAKRVKVIRP